MSDPLSCEGWDTGKPFLGVPSKFVVINEDGEEIGTLAELIPLLMLVSNNLSDIEDAVEARNNLGVYSNDEVDTAIGTAIETATPQATSEVKGQAKIATTAIAQAGVNDTDFITPLKLKNTVIGVGDLGWIDRTGNRTLGINYTNDGKLRIVRVSGRASTTGMWITATIDGKTMIISSGSGTNSEMLQAYAFIPSGKVYSININAGTLTNITWDEM